MGLFSSAAGDTIVEVLIAMTVASTVLGGSYAVVNHTMANTRQAQEHSEALQVANGQVERIIALSSSDTQNLFSTVSVYHCADKTTGALVNLALPANDSSLPADVSSYPAACKDIGSVHYRTAFKYDSTNQSFKVYVNWPSVTGNGEDQITMAYKAYRP